MANISLVNTSSNSIVLGGAGDADKFRVTWTRDDISRVLPFQAVVVAAAIREWLPTRGFVAVSNPSAVAGDVAVVYDVRPTAQWSGRTVAEMVSALNAVPLIGSSTFLAIPQSVTVTRVEKVRPGSSPAELAAGQGSARDDAQTADAARSFLESIASTLTGGVGLVALAAGAVILATLAVRRR